jgi:hypothetical protein
VKLAKAMIRRGLHAAALLVTAVWMHGCHSACFQTAEIRSGVDATMGVTRIRGADDAEVSRYSIFVKGEYGRSAAADRFGYGLGLTFIAPFESRGRSIMGGDKPESGSFPNEWAGVLPEFRLQVPRRLPVDLALDVRLMAVSPERVGVLASRRVVSPLTAYVSYFLNVDIGQLAVAGCDIRLTGTLSLLAEYSLWLSDHDYPADYSGSRRRRPYSAGLALTYHIPRKQEPYDSRPYALAGEVREEGK